MANALALAGVPVRPGFVPAGGGAEVDAGGPLSSAGGADVDAVRLAQRGGDQPLRIVGGAQPAGASLRGTPLLPWALRLLGARIGRGVYLDTTDLTEFDCVRIGDEAELNAWCGPQTHLFEDRVMKIGCVEIGAGVRSARVPPCSTTRRSATGSCWAR